MDMASNNGELSDGISVCSYNCRSFKNSLPSVNMLCARHDIVLIQEHWLIPDDLPLLNNAHMDFISVGLSAMDLSAGMLVGRPFGGTAILFRKCFADKITIVETNESRITGIQINTESGPLLLLNVYMPTNYGDDASLEAYIDCLCKLHVLILETDAIHTVIAGDFNCSPDSRFFAEFTKFAIDNNLVTADLNRLRDVCTYVSDDGTKISWVDHILCTAAIDTVLDNITVLNEIIMSDHRPLSFKIQCKLYHSGNSGLDVGPHGMSYNVPMWSSCDALTLQYYASYLDNLLQDVHVPYDALYDVCRDQSNLLSIDRFYEDIFSSISKAVATVIPSRKRPVSSFNVPGWNTYVQEKHVAAREAFLAWVEIGRPRCGYQFDVMRKTRAVFKLALRYCRNHIEELKADACADSLFDTDSRKFWSNVYKLSNNKASSHVVSVGGATGAQNVANMWKDHFQRLYSNGTNTKYRTLFDEQMRSRTVDTNMCYFTMHDVILAIGDQKTGKAPGPDGINMEALKHSGNRLKLYLSILFNLLMLYGYVPDAFHQATIIPLVKCKSGDLSDVNNYRAIALSNAVTKVLEAVLFPLIESYDLADEYQFGFKKKHSTAICTHIFKKTVSHYRQNGSHVFSCFIDFNKAFDNVDYWHLFCKLASETATAACWTATCLLAFWYSHQQMAVRWQNSSSEAFRILNGVRQGGLLSPFLFRFYIREMIDKVTRLNIGCNLLGTNVNLLAYADDIVLLAPTWYGLQQLLSVLEHSAADIGMHFNTKKTVCMIFNPCDKRKIVKTVFQAFEISGCKLVFVDQFKYLGHIINNSLHDDSDINRELRCLFVRANLLCRRFHRCSLEVKLKLFRTFCICFYDTALWANFSVTALAKFTSSYNKCLKLFFGYLKYSSVTKMLVELGLPSCNTVLHNCKVTFVTSLQSCNNTFVKCLAV